MRKILIYLSILLTGIGWGCSDWLDVKPSDRISEDNAFSSIAGFKNALNGIYVELNKDNLYGRRLTVDFVEILAKRYHVHSENEWAYDLMNYEYGGSTVKGYLEGIWGTAYKLIANTNLLIKNCDQNREVLPDDYYGICKGEALALRAMLHFDLFRLFGPVYSVDSMALSIPYYKEFSLEIAPQLSGVDFMDNVVDDLLEASDLLEVDPILTDGVQGSFDDYFLQDRNLRLNYYAVQGLLARAYLYKEDKANALLYAKKVIEAHENLFPWVNPMDINASHPSPDRIFSSEVMFALHNTQRSSVYTTLFNAKQLKLNTLLAPTNWGVSEPFAGCNYFDQNYYRSDYRYISNFNSSVELNGTQYMLFHKYETSNDSLYNQMIPLVKISEMYLIAAETETDQAKAGDYINAFRNNRGLPNVSSIWFEYGYLPDFVDAEYPKEFCGEGQLFFYYKRRNKTTIWDGDGYQKRISTSNYVLPIPDAELQYQ